MQLAGMHGLHALHVAALGVLLERWEDATDPWVTADAGAGTRIGEEEACIMALRQAALPTAAATVNGADGGVSDYARSSLLHAVKSCCADAWARIEALGLAP